MPFAVLSEGDTFKVVNTKTGRVRSTTKNKAFAESDARIFNEEEQEKLAKKAAKEAPITDEERSHYKSFVHEETFSGGEKKYSFRFGKGVKQTYSTREDAEEAAVKHGRALDAKRKA